MASKPWVEKYRPKKLEDVSFQENALALIEGALQQRSLSHFLFYGPPGTGKTSVGLIIARRLFGSSYASRVLELNASDDRGIDVVREKIKVRASRKCCKTENMPDFQLILLDEADCMTSDAQKALLRTMEVYSKNTRFIIICNYVSRMIGPLASRCSRVRFHALPEEAMKQRIDNICRIENVRLEPAAFQVLSEASKGDLRRAIMFLQSAVKSGGNYVSESTVLNVSGRVPENGIELFEAMCIEGPACCLKAVQEFINDGYTAQQIVIQLAERILKSGKYNDLQKAEIFEVMSEVDLNLSVGASEILQLLWVSSVICQTANRMME